MSWTVVVLDYGGNPPSSLATPDNPLGPADQVRESIAEHLPGVDWSDPAWGSYLGEGFTIEFNVGDQDPIYAITLHVHGGVNAVQAMLAFANPNGWSLWNDSAGKFLDPENPSSEG